MAIKVVDPDNAEAAEIEGHNTGTPSYTFSLGVKGMGEASTITAAQAVITTVADKLEPFGFTAVFKPMTADTVWGAEGGW